MNLKRFLESVPEEWQIDTELSSLKHLYDEIIYEMQEYADDTASDFVVLQDNTVYQMLVILKAFINTKEADGNVQADLRRIAEKLI